VSTDLEILRPTAFNSAVLFEFVASLFSAKKDLYCAKLVGKTCASDTKLILFLPVIGTDEHCTKRSVV
jgi:hypothetical protein